MKYSFYNWCIDNGHQDVLNRWDNDLNTCYPQDISYRSRQHCYFKCVNNKQHNSELFRIDHITTQATSMACKQCNSFYQWCIDNNQMELIEAWDTTLNQDDIHYVPHSSGKKYYFKVLNNCPSVLYCLSDITGYKRLSPIKKFYNSFGYYLFSTYGKDAIKHYWSEKNQKTPWEYDRCSGQKVWFKCTEKDYHTDYFSSIDKFKYGCRCPWCAGKLVHPLDSFAQYNINRLGEDFIDKYWSKDNTIDPWTIRPFANDTIVRIQCQDKTYHQYDITAANFSLGTGCSYCSNSKIHPFDSLGALFPQIISIWSDKNTKSPYEYHPYSHEYVWIKCEDGVHDDYCRRISDITYQNFTRCPKCVKSDRESWFQKNVRLFLENMPYKVTHEFDCSIVPINPSTKMKMPFDNEIQNIDGKNLIVEVHGIQHYELNGWHIARSKRTGKTPMEELEYQKWKDNFKKEFAMSCGYEYLEIPYYTIIDGTYKDLINTKINFISMK